VALDAMRPLVPAGYLAFRIEHEDRVVFHALRQQTNPFLVLPQRILSPLALGNVPDESEHKASASIRVVDQPYGAQGQLYVDLIAAFGQCGQFQQPAGVDVGSAARLSVASYARPMLDLSVFGY